MHGDEPQLLPHVLLLSFLVEVDSMEVEDLFGADRGKICSYDLADLT